MLIGRERECRALDVRIDAIHQSGGATVLRGEAGVGKSSLLEAVRIRAAGQGLRVLATAGVPSESQLPFAALHHLLSPVLDEVEQLPSSQREAVRAAFGFAGGASSPGLFPIALATLHLLGEVAARAPLLVLVDDVHWLDPPTADVLAFIARRLEADPVLVLAAIRDGFESALLDASLPELRLEPLTEVCAAALLDARDPELAPSVRERVLREAAGNPLALVELPVALRSAGVRDGAAPPPWLPITARLEQAFAARVSKLPDATRILLLVAASDEGADLADLLRAASEVSGQEVPLDAATEAVRARLVEINGSQLRFRHPLMRSAIHETTTPSERATVHSALAALARDPDRRAWHHAAAVIGSDEVVAHELEETAERSQRRGAAASAMAAFERAAQLSDDPVLRGGRLVRAAELAFQLGRHAEVVRLLGEAERLGLGPLEQPRLAWLRELFEEGSWSGVARVRAFVEIAERMRRGGDGDRALDALSNIALRCWWSNPDEADRELVVSVAERIPVSATDPRLLAILALAAPVERARVVLDRLDRSHPADPGAEALHLLGLAATGVGAFVEAERFLEDAVAALRAQGRLGLLAQALVSQAWSAIHRGRWKLANLATGEAARLARETVQPLWVTVAELAEATVAAYRGNVEKAEALAASGESVLLPIGANPMLALVQLSRGAAALGEARHTEAYEQLHRIFDSDDIAYHPLVRSWALVDLVEAAWSCGRQGEAQEIVRELEPLARKTRSPLLLAALDFARPLLASEGQAEPAFTASLGPRLAAWPFVRARLELALGTWLRRQRRVADCRAPLRTARDAFDALGASPWGDRARRELRASGEISRSRAGDRLDALSAQELQIAQMAARGMTNKEIGRQLYLSHRTVGSHLYRIFPKLGITARSQIRGALEGRAGSS